MSKRYESGASKPKHYYWWQRYRGGVMGDAWNRLPGPLKDQMARASNWLCGGLIINFLIGSMIAFFTPLNILSYSWAKGIVAITALAAPIIKQVPPQSPIANVVQFYFGVMWLLVPFFFFWFFALMNMNLRTLTLGMYVKEDLCRERIGSRARMIVAIAIFSIIVIGSLHLQLTDLYKPSYWPRRMLWQSRFSLASMGFVTTMIFALGAPMAVTSCRVLLIVWPHLPWFRSKKSS